MKYFYLLALLFLLTMEINAQSLNDASGLSVLQKKWQVQSVKPFNSLSTEDPFQANDEANQMIRDQKENLRQNTIRQQSGLPMIPPPVRQKRVSDVKSRPETTSSYVYQIKIKNDGTKTIKKVVWEYVFFDPATKQEVGRHEFVSVANLKPRETDTLVMKLFSAPAGSIDVKDIGKKTSDIYTEQVNIKSILYADNSVWKADSK